MADGDVPLHGEGCNGARGRVDAQVLQVCYGEAAAVAVHPLPEQGLCDVGYTCRRQHDEVCDRQTHQVAVSRSPHVFSREHHEDHHHVPHDPGAAYEYPQQHTHHFVLDALVGPYA